MATRVLVVDDDAALCRALRRTLEAGKLSVRTAGSASEAMQKASEIAFDAIVLDWGLPDGNGPALTAALRTAGVDCPVIMLTGRESEDDTQTYVVSRRLCSTSRRRTSPRTPVGEPRMRNPGTRLKGTCTWRWE
jgi:CheY-like chemotaxis protein